MPSESLKAGQLVVSSGLWPVAQLAGATKSIYDLALWRLFRPVRLPADATRTTGGTL